MKKHVQRAVLHLMCQPDSSKRFFPNAKAVREAMDVFDNDTRTCSPNTKHGQTGGYIQYVCQSVCNNSQNLWFTILQHAEFLCLKQLTKSVVYNSPLAHIMLSFCKNINAPEIIQVVEREQGAAAGATRTLVGGGCTTWVNTSL